MKRFFILLSLVAVALVALVSCNFEDKGDPICEHTNAIETVREDEVAPTCSKEGSYYEVTYCVECLEKLRRDYCTIPALEHIPGDPVVIDEKEASCTSDGKLEKAVYCTECETFISSSLETLERLSHTYVGGVCVGCGGYQNQGLEFVLNDDGDSYSLKSCGSNTDAVVYIPASHNSLPVTAILERAFSGNTNLATIYIPSSIAHIANNAFDNCSLLQYNEHDNALYLGSEQNPYHILIKAKSRDITECSIHGETKYILDYAFSRCDKLSSVVISDGVLSIGKYAFAGCASLSDISLGRSVVEIKDRAFSECTSLLTITLPESLESVANNAFYGCDKLVELVDNSNLEIEKPLDTVITVHSGESLLDNIDGFIFLKLGVENYLVAYLGEGRDITLPNDYYGQSYEIYRGAFYKNSKIQNVTIGDFVTLIGDEAFYECKRLCTVTLGERVVSIGKNAFRNCSSLDSVELSDKLETIELSAFYGCEWLYNVVIPDSVSFIGDSAFANCVFLSNITLPDKVIIIERGAFNNTQYYKTSENWEGGLLYIGNHLVSADKAGASATVRDGTLTVSEGCFTGREYLQTVIIPTSVRFIGKNAFGYCPSLRNVYYKGSGMQWGFIEIMEGNDLLIRYVSYNY